MDTQSQTQPVTADSIKIALLENNEAIYTRMDKAIKENATEITKAVNTKTEGYIDQVTGLAKETGALEVKVTALENWKTNMWAKILGIQAVVGFIFAVIGWILGGGHVGH